MDALGFKKLREVLSDVLVEASEGKRLTEDEVDLGSVAMEVASEFHCDVTSTNDHELLGLLWQRQSLVRGDHGREVGAWNRQLDRPAASGDTDELGGESLTVDLDGVRVDDLRIALVVVDVGPLEEIPIDAVQPSHFCILRLDKFLPVQGWFGARRKGPSVAFGIFDFLSEVGSIDEQFLRDAAPNHASPAKTTDGVLGADDSEWHLSDCYLCTILRSSPSGAPNAT
mmetsp:Transcript_6161/g.14307  ORF Transcript_6161/g.14307 Transcript_6161/m.14307 type:complete len:227 (-) Transcript_6161:380-1060(-)